jgi:carboxyl-terminal processing protease
MNLISMLTERDDNQGLPVPESPRARKAVGTYLAVIFIISSFLWGYRLGTQKSAASTASASGTVEFVNTDVDRSGGTIDFNLYWELWDIIKQRYVKQPVDQKKLFYGALSGMVASLGDPHSIFLEPTVSQQFTQELSGAFEGIGAEIGAKKGNLVIVAPLPGSPAEKAGLKPGDRIAAIDGLDATGMALDEAVNHIRGPKGTQVKLLILRGTETALRAFSVTRDTIAIQSVKVSYEKSPKGKTLGVITVTNFNSDTFDRFLDAVTEVRAKNVDGLVLDLRNNPGGFLDAAVGMLGEWSPGDVVVSERFSDGSKQEHRATGKGRLSDLKTIVLVNGGSASASEITAGALQDLGKGKLLGTQTFGKGSVQDLIDLKDGSSVKLTIAEWLTPNGKNINIQGITPDYVVDMTADDVDNNRDPQMTAAQAWFDGVIPPAPKTPPAPKP